MTLEQLRRNSRDQIIRLAAECGAGKVRVFGPVARGETDSRSDVDLYAQRGRIAFDEDELIRAWIVHHLEILGEACRGLSDDFRKAHPDELWSDVVSFSECAGPPVLWN